SLHDAPPISISTPSAPASVQRKQDRHWSLNRMLCWPARSPLSASRRLPGGGLPPFRGHGVCLRCEREFIGVGAFVGVRGLVAAPGVAALGVVAGEPGEHRSTADRKSTR